MRNFFLRQVIETFLLRSNVSISVFDHFKFFLFRFSSFKIYWLNLELIKFLFSLLIFF
jgi:hypothetical protein